MPKQRSRILSISDVKVESRSVLDFHFWGLTELFFSGIEMALSGAAPSRLNANVHQGYFAESLVASIAAAAGLDVQFPRLGHVIDLGIFKPGPNGTSGSRQINLQVKSWSTGVLAADDNFHYPLEVSAFNQLAGSGHDVRHYLVLCIVPDSASDYSDAQHHRLRLQRAAYWLSLRNEMPDSTLNPHSTKTVLIPRINLLTASTIQALVANEERLAVIS